MQADMALALDRIDLDGGTQARKLRVGLHAVVPEVRRAVYIVGCLGLQLHIVARLDRHLAHNRAVAEEEGLVLRRAVRQVQLKGHAPQVEAVTQGDIVDILARSVLHGVERVEGAESSVAAHPHQVVGVHLLRVFGAEGALGHLGHERVVAALERVGHTRTKLVAPDRAAELRIEIGINRGDIVLVATHAHHLLTAREGPAVVGARVAQVEPIDRIEKGVILVDLVQAMAVGIAHAVAEVAVDDEIDEAALEARFIADVIAVDRLAQVVHTRLETEFQELLLGRSREREKRQEKQRKEFFHRGVVVSSLG